MSNATSHDSRTNAASLAKEYDAIATEVGSAMDAWTTLHAPGWRGGRRAMWLMPSRSRRYLRETKPQELERLAERRKRQDGKSDKAQFYGAVTSPYFIEALAAHVRKQRDLSPDQTQALLMLHDDRCREAEAYGGLVRLSWLLPAALVGAGILAAPKDAFEVVHAGGAYGWLRFVVAALLVLVAVLALVLLLFARSDTLRTQRVTGLVLRQFRIEDLAYPTRKSPDDPLRHR